MLPEQLACLHPVDGWRQQPEVVKALDLAQRGELSVALHILRPLQTIKSEHGLGAMVILFQISHQWDEFLALQARLPVRLQKRPQLLQTMLRALGETGDRRGLVEFYQRHRQKIARLAPPAQRDAMLLLFLKDPAPEVRQGGLVLADRKVKVKRPLRGWNRIRRASPATARA